MQKVFLYSDVGVGSRSLRMAAKELSSFGYFVQLVNAKQVLAGKWRNEASIFVMPGGRDVFYDSSLRGEGNRMIREYVEEGGCYLGLCAGAYYASSCIEFDKGGALHVCQERELAFYSGVARGPLFTSFRYGHDEEGVIIQVDWKERYPCFYLGGCCFIGEDAAVARYGDLPGKPAAIVKTKVGEGKAILSGVHPEFSAKHWAPRDAEKQLVAKLAISENGRASLFAKLMKECQSA